MSESQNRFGDLPVYPASWEPGSLDFPEGADFEATIEDWVLQGEMESSVDEVMTGHPSPRIWLLLHEPGQGRLTATAALAFARELASRDQGVLILDCDETDSTLTRWAQRTGAEGWADLVRYGASVLTCGIRLPFAGRQGYLLGPGSYVPVDVLTEEIQQIIARLRRQADDILLVCPSGDTGRRWAGAATIRVLCRDAGTMPTGRATEIVEAFDEAGTPLTGLIRFGDESSEESTEELLDAVLEETDGESITPDTEPTPVEAEVPQDEAFDFGADEPEEPEEREAAAANAEVDPMPDDRPVPGEFARKRGTSRVFWWVALGAAALIVMSVWYYREYVMEPTSPVLEGESTEVAVVDADGATSDPVVHQPAETDAGTQEDPGAGTADEQIAMVEDTAVDTADEVLAQTPPVTTPAETPAPTPSDEPEAQPAESTTPDSAVAEEGFRMDPYLGPVGEGGWALHIYSFPDEESTEAELAILHRKGFRTETRAVQIKDKGRWHRIYLGSFPDKKSAQAALPLLLEELREDWGRPTQF